MSHAPKNNPNLTPDWQPTASREMLVKRANIIHAIHQFFRARDVLSVETPLLCPTSVTDPYIESIPVTIQDYAHQPTRTYYLQTSPEYAMKRLLAAGSGSIYQLCKSFRQEELGAQHHREFTMLEWYRVGFDHHQLMDEMDDLLQTILNTEKAERITYQTLFESHLSMNPHTATQATLVRIAKDFQLHLPADDLTETDLLQLLMSMLIEPRIGQTRPCFIYDFPAAQAALSQLQATEPPVASRFEVYFKGMELANGFHELTDPIKQRDRFMANQTARSLLHKPNMAIDEAFLAALESGLPNCAGVALGLDRLIMLATHAQRIDEVISFRE